MNTTAWLIVAYIALDRLLTIAYIGRPLTITRTVAITSMFTGAALIWGVVSLASAS